MKQRKIVQWVIGYFAGAWIALEVFDLIAEQFLWPAWIRQASTVLVFFGGLVTIILAWYHGERGRQKVSAVEFVMLVVILAVGGQSIWLLKSRSDRLDAESSQTAFQFRDKPPPEHSVAVLPCANLSDDEKQGYFADGLAAELITRLAAVSGLRIPSHTSSFSFRGQNVTLQAVSASLNVRHVLECDVFGDESRIRIGARLIDVQTGYTLWSESYDRGREMLLDVQRDVAAAVVQNLEVRLLDRERLLVGRRWTNSPEAYDEFLRGIKLQLGPPDRDSLASSLGHLEQATRLDPDFGRAYARIAIHWVIVGNYGYAPSAHAYRETESFARRAIEIDGDLFEAHWALGWTQFLRYDWPAAQKSFRKVIELAPGNWEGYHSLGFLNGVLGRYDEAMTAARIAIDLDPLAFWPRRGLEILYYRQREFDQAIQVTLEIAARNGWNPFMRAYMGMQLARAGRRDEAREYLAEAEAAGATDNNVLSALACGWAALGEQERGRSIAEPIRQQYRDSGEGVLPGTLAITYACLGDHEQAMEYLLLARQNEDIELLFLDDPSFDGMRAHPGFEDLVRSLGLPEHVYLARGTGS